MHEHHELLLAHVGEHRGHVAVHLDDEPGLALVPPVDAPDTRVVEDKHSHRHRSTTHLGENDQTDARREEKKVEEEAEKAEEEEEEEEEEEAGEQEEEEEEKEEEEEEEEDSTSVECLLRRTPPAARGCPS